MWFVSVMKGTVCIDGLPSQQRHRQVATTEASEQWEGAHGKPVMDIWVQNSQQSLGAEPLVTGQGAKPPETDSF